MVLIQIIIMVKVNQTPHKTKPLRLKKYFSAPALVDHIRKDFEKIPDLRRNGQQCSLPDVLLSGLAVVGLKYPSLWKFAEHRNEERLRTNLRNRYGVIQAPGDTQLRPVLDEVSPAEWRLPFISIQQQLHSQKIVEAYRYLGSCLVTWDGTGQFCCCQLNCLDCCEKHQRNGAGEY